MAKSDGTKRCNVENFLVEKMSYGWEKEAYLSKLTQVTPFLDAIVVV